MKPIPGMLSGVVCSQAAIVDRKELHRTQRLEEERQEHSLKPQKDEYVPEEKKDASGRYWLTKGADGTLKIQFDDPERKNDGEKGTAGISDADMQVASLNGKKQADAAAEGKRPDDPDEDEKPDSPAQKSAGRKAEKCTGNTDKVDREIRKLKQKKKELEQQIRSETDEDKAKELERKLAQVEGELRRKDNDAYRRQHSTFT